MSMRQHKHSHLLHHNLVHATPGATYDAQAAGSLQAGDCRLCVIKSSLQGANRENTSLHMTMIGSAKMACYCVFTWVYIFDSVHTALNAHILTDTGTCIIAEHGLQSVRQVAQMTLEKLIAMCSQLNDGHVPRQNAGGCIASAAACNGVRQRQDCCYTGSAAPL